MGTNLLAFFVAFVCVFAAHSSEGNRKLAGSFLNNGVSWDVQDIDEDKAEQVWTYCQKELKYSAEAIKELDLAPSQLSAKTIVQMAMADLSPKEKEAVLECLRTKDFPLQVPSYLQETSSYQDWLSDWGSIPRRYLRGKRRSRFRNRRRSRTHAPVRDNLRVIKTSPTPGPALPPANFAPSLRDQVPSSPASFASSRIEVQAPSPSPAPGLPPPAKAPAPSDFISSPSPSDFNFHPELPNRSFSPLPSQSTNVDRKYIIAAVIGSALAVFLLLAFFLFLCFKKRTNKVQPKDGQRDENPLLNLCASDISSGSSQKSVGIGNPSTKDFKASLAVGGLSGAANSSSKAESPTIEAQAVGKADSTLPHPPGKTAPPAPPTEPPPSPPKPPAPAPPPPPVGGRRPPNPPKPSPLGPHHRRVSTGEGSEVSDDCEAPKTKLKPFFWDKVLASPDHSMVWHEIKAGSFQFDEEMMKTLFGYVPAEKNKNDNKKDLSSFDNPQQFVQIMDPKKSQNLAILLKALNVTTEEVCDALREGNELPAELIQTLLKMAPTTDEELKLRLYSGDVCHLGPAERFLKVMVEIPFAFKRLQSLLFVSTFQEEVPSVKESFATLEVACKELRNSRRFLKLLEAVLKTGNRMNDGTYRGGAQAFKLDTLLKLSDVKGIDGKTTLLHFVVHEIIRSEGVRAARRLRESRSMSSVETEDLVEDSTHETEEYHRSLGLQVVSGLSNELGNVRKAALIDLDSLRETVSKLGLSLAKTREFLDTEMKGVEGESEFYDALSGFVHQSESDVNWLQEEEKRITHLVRSTGDYFHGKSGRDEASHLFVIVRDFLLMLDKACKDVKSSTKLPSKMPRKEASATSSPSQESAHESALDLHRRLFPAMRERQLDDDFSSDDEN